MPHTIFYNSDLKVIETKVQGILMLPEAKDIAQNITQLGVEMNCFRCLTDYREATIKLSTLELHNFPDTLSEITDSHGVYAYRFKRAIITSTDYNQLRFFETVSINRGQSIKLFTSREEGMKWLNGE